MRLSLVTATLASLMLASPIIAEGGYTTYPFDGDFDDATFSLESAIIGQGLVIDYVSKTGDMLERTREDVGSDVQLFDNAAIYVFCSAALSRKMMEADPMNLAQCPYGIFVADQGGEVVIGFRDYPEGIMQEVQALLDQIVREATE